MIYLLSILLILLLIIEFFVYRKNILQPAILFTLSFVAVTISASLNSQKWSLKLHLNTFLVILLGVFEFFCVSYIFSKLVERKKIKVIKLEKNKKVKSYKDIKNNCDSLRIININTLIEVIFLIFIIISDIIYIHFILKASKVSFSGISSIFNGINKYNDLLKFSDEFKQVEIPFFISNIKVGIQGCGYWFLYVVINNFINGRKIKILELLIVIFSILTACLTGSRGFILMYVISGIVYYLIIKLKTKGVEKMLNKKLIYTILVIILVFSVFFVMSTKLLKRDINKDPLNYLSIYCGAQVKNLDIYIRQRHKIKKINNYFGAQTFGNIIRTYGNKIGFKGYKQYRNDLPFRSVNGYGLGNVYTTFYPYIYDFGYLGVFVLVFIMAILSQVSFEYVKKVKIKNYPNISFLIYGLICYTLILSFFSNNFYGKIFSTEFIKYVSIWYMCNLIFIKLGDKLKQKNSQVRLKIKL